MAVRGGSPTGAGWLRSGLVEERRMGMGNRKACRIITAAAEAAAELLPRPFRPRVAGINITDNTHTYTGNSMLLIRRGLCGLSFLPSAKYAPNPARVSFAC